MSIFQMKHILCQYVRLSLIKIENLKGTKRIRYLRRYYAIFQVKLILCISVSPSVCQSVHCPSVSLSVNLFVRQSVCPSVRLSSSVR